MITKIIIVNYNTKDLLKNCLKSIVSKQWDYRFEIAVVDNGSVDGSIEMVKKEYPQVKLIEVGKNLGFSGGNNVALAKQGAKYYCLLNSDTEVLPNSLDSLVDFMNQTKFSIVSCKLLNKDKTLQPNFGDLPFGFSLLSWITGLDDIPYLNNILPSFHKNSANDYQGEKEVGWVSGSVMMINEEVLQKVGLFDDKLFMYGEDVEYCLRAKKAGFKIGWTDQAEIIHLGGGSSKDPAFRQWSGEFKGLIYIYQKNFGLFWALILKVVFYFFILVRMISFSLIGRVEVSKTYGKILFNI